MTTAERQFTDELEIFRMEVAGATQFLFTALAINELARRSDKTLRALNREPLFWKTVAAGLQSSAFMAIGRVFDHNSKHNVDAVLRLAERNRNIFSKDGLANRKRTASENADQWLPDYLATAYVPNAKDFRGLRRRVADKRKSYEAQFRRLRHHYFAHKMAATPAEIAPVSANAKIRDLERLVIFLNQLHETLGRRPSSSCPWGTPRSSRTWSARSHLPSSSRKMHHRNSVGFWSTRRRKRADIET